MKKRTATKKEIKKAKEKWKAFAKKIKIEADKDAQKMEAEKENLKIDILGLEKTIALLDAKKSPYWEKTLRHKKIALAAVTEIVEERKIAIGLNIELNFEDMLNTSGKRWKPE